MTGSISSSSRGIEGPRDPQDPAVTKKEASPQNYKKDKKETGASAYHGRAEITTVGGNRFTGKVEIPMKHLVVAAKYSISGKRETVSFQSIKKITILSWMKSEKRGKAWVFSPHRIRVETREGSVIHVSGREFVRKMKITRKKSSFYLYTIYYDYWKRGKWRFSGGRSFGGIVKRGHGKAMREMAFLQSSVELPADNILDLYLRRGLK